MKSTRSKPKSSFVSRALADRVILTRLSFIANIILVLVVIIQPHFILQQLSVPQRAIIIDGAGSYTASPLLDISTATPLHASCAADAALALLSRNPGDFDRPDELQSWFTESGRTKAQALQQAEASDFLTKQFHQKVVITDEIITTATGRESFTAQVSGQLIRTGVLNDRLHVETVDFDLLLRFVLNPDMFSNKRYPYATWDFDIRYRQ